MARRANKRPMVPATSKMTVGPAVTREMPETAAAWAIPAKALRRREMPETDKTVALMRAVAPADLVMVEVPEEMAAGAEVANEPATEFN